jgi:hypothetical protein
MPSKNPGITITLFPDDRDLLRDLHARTGVKTSCELGRMGLRALDIFLKHGLNIESLRDALARPASNEASP